MDKPREWWIYREPNSNRAIIAAPGETRAWEGIHVIEYSAYEVAMSRIDNMQNQIGLYNRESNDRACEMAALTKERNAARDEAADWRQQLVAERMKSAKLVGALKQVQMLFHSKVDLPGKTQDLIHENVDKALAEYESQDSIGESK